MSRKQNRARGGHTDGCLIPTHFLLQNALAGGFASILASPNANLSPRALDEADAWAHFRILSLKFRLHANETITAMLAAGYVGGIQDTPPTTFPNTSELLPCCFRGIAQTVPSDWVHVPRKDLAGPFPWYKTIPGAADATEEAPGSIQIVGSATSAFSIEMVALFEFKTAVSTGNTPLEVQIRQKIREERRQRADMLERDRLLKTMSVVPTRTGGS